MSTKGSLLTAMTLAEVAVGDLLYIIDVSAGTAGSKNITVAEFFGGGATPSGKIPAYDSNGLLAASSLTTSTVIIASSSPTWTGVHTFTPAARSSGVAPAFLFNTPADTGTTASTERIEFSVPGAVVTWATGALTTQRFNVFGADTIAFAGASTCTTAVGNEWASPVAGTNATLTSSIAGRFLASASGHTALVAKAGAATPTGKIQEWQMSDGAVFAAMVYDTVASDYGLRVYTAGGSNFISLCAGYVVSSTGTIRFSANNVNTHMSLSTTELQLYPSHKLCWNSGEIGFLRVDSNQIKTFGQANTSILGAFLCGQATTSTIGLTTKGIASATADAFQVQNSSGTALFQIGAPAVQTTGSPTFITVTPPAHTTLTASTEAIDENHNLSRTVQFATGALTTQRAFLIQAPTYGFVGASTITTAVGLEVNSPSAGTNATLTKSIAGRFVASSAAHVPLVIKGATSQTGNVLEIHNSTNTVVGGISASCSFLAPSATGQGFFLTDSSLNTLYGFYGAGLVYGSWRPFASTNWGTVQYPFSNVSAQTLTAFNTANNTISLTVGGGSGRTSPLIQLRTYAGGSLGNVGGCIFDDFTDAASTHTDGTFDTLLTHTTVANSLAVNGDKIEFDFVINIVSHVTATSQVKVTFGGITIFDSGAVNYAANTCVRVVGQVMRKTSTTCRAVVQWVPDGLTVKTQYTADGTLTGLTLSSTNILAVTAAAANTNAASGDITAVMNSVDVIPAGS